MKVLKWLDEHLEQSILMLLLSAIVVVMLYQIIRRYVFNDSLAWSEEFCRYCFIWFIFIAFSYSIRLNTELRVDGVLNLLPAGVRKVVEFVVLVVCLALTLYLFVHSFTTVDNMAALGEYSPGMKLPMKYVYASPVAGFGLGTLRYIQRLAIEWKHRKQSGREPV